MEEKKKKKRTNLSSKCGHVIRHFNGVRESLLVPHEILVVVRILDIKPKHINGHIFLIKPPLNHSNIFRAYIVPPTLVVSQAPLWRHDRSPGKPCVLPEYVFWSWTGKEERIQDSR